MRIRTRSIIIMVSQALQQAVNIVVPIILVRMISKEMLGSYRQVFLAYGLLAGLFSYQLGNSLYYFLPRLGEERRRTLLAQTFLGTATRAVVITLVMLLGAGPIAGSFHSSELVTPLRLVGLYGLCDSLADLVPAFMISLDRPVRAGLYSLIAAISRVSAVIAAFALGGSLSLVIGVAVVVQTAVMLAGCADMIRLSPRGQWRLDRQLMRDQWNYSWPLWPTAVVATFSILLDKLVISYFFDAATFAVYSCGAIDLPVIALVTNSLSAAMMPSLVTLISQGRRGEALAVWQEAARKSSFLVFPCFAFFLVVSQDFILLLYGQQYAAAVWPFRVYLAMLPLKVVVYGAIFRACGATRTIAVGSLLTLVTNILLSITFTWAGHGSWLSFIGPSLAASTAAFAAGGFFLFRLQRIVEVPSSRIMRWGELSRVLALSVACGLVLWLTPVPALPLVLSLAVRGLIFAALFGAAVLLTGTLKPDEMEMVTIPLRAVRHVLRGRQPRQPVGKSEVSV